MRKTQEKPGDASARPQGRVWRSSVQRIGTRRRTPSIGTTGKAPVSSLSVGKTIRLLRLGETWSQSELARRASLPQATISLVEGGKSLTLENLGAVAQAFGMSSSSLIKMAERKESAGGTVRKWLEIAEMLADGGWDPGKLDDLMKTGQ